jgi:hypothetical protein
MKVDTTIDNAMAVCAAAEATWKASAANVATIQAAIATATEPLIPAQEKLSRDTGGYISALLELAAAAQQQVAALAPRAA